MTAKTYLAQAWSATDFRTPEMSAYAEKLMRLDTRHGVQILALLMLLVQICIPLFVLKLGLPSAHAYTYTLLGLLSLHVLISAKFVSDVRSLQFLGIVLLTISAMAVMFLAHSTGALNIGMMAAIVMLFIAVPVVPWGVREVAIVIPLTYLLLTSSLISVPGRFDPIAFWTLQSLVLGSSLIVTVIVARNAYTRKQDIQTRFELESARKEMELLSLQDHLTGAWNRRYLDTRFAEIAARCKNDGETLHVAVLDIDNFKVINDHCGHHLADEILAHLGEVFIRHLGSKGRFIRLGGDEFQILYAGDNLRELIDDAVLELQSKLPIAKSTGMDGVTLSAGFTSVPPNEWADADKVYKAADKALYLAKRNKVPLRELDESEISANSSTGTWKL